MQDKDYVYISLGSNIGERKKNFIEALKLMEENNIKIIEISPLYDTPALLLKGSPSEWNIPYLNCCVKIDTNINPFELLKILKNIEIKIGHDFINKWAPRLIDIDILFYKDQTINTEELTIPHKQIKNRYFILDALSFIYYEKAREFNYYTNEHQSVFMGILNITPDSFSDGGLYNHIENFSSIFNMWEENNIGIIDIGAESTRPNAKPITYLEELKRLEFVFRFVKNKNFNYFKPLLSIDTYHYQTAQVAIENNFNIINDVSGFDNPNMIDLAKNNKKIKFIFMHSLGIPANKNVYFNNNQDVILEINRWLENKINILEKNNIKKEQIIFDIGIGFGKNYSQALQLLQNIEYFQKFGIKIMVGGSRKSFMKNIINPNYLDVGTLACSLKLANKVDILRVHKPIEHKQALLMSSHLNNQFFTF